MLTKLIQLGLIGGSLLGTILLYYLLLRISEEFFTSPRGYVLMAVIGVYLYGAATFLAMKGIHLFSKPE